MNKAGFNYENFHQTIQTAISHQVARLGKEDFPEHDLAKDYPILAGAIVMSILWALYDFSCFKNLSPTDMSKAVDAALAKLDEIGVERVYTPMGAIIFQWKKK